MKVAAAPLKLTELVRARLVPPHITPTFRLAAPVPFLARTVSVPVDALNDKTPLARLVLIPVTLPPMKMLSTFKRFAVLPSFSVSVALRPEVTTRLPAVSVIPPPRWMSVPFVTTTPMISPNASVTIAM